MSTKNTKNTKNKKKDLQFAAGQKEVNKKLKSTKQFIISYR